MTLLPLQNVESGTILKSICLDRRCDEKLKSAVMSLKSVLAEVRG